MKGLASILLVIVVVTHYGYEPMAGFYADPGHAARAIFYVLRGLEASLLYLIVWALTPWKPIYVRLAVSAVCAWGALESVQTSLCRISLGIDNTVGTKPYQGLCDLVTGLPVYMMTLILVLLIFAFQYTKQRE